MIFKPFYYYETGCAAYLFGCGGQGVCAVADPQEKDVDSYIEFAKAKNMRITDVFDTHIHADHRSGGRQLAAKVGAAYHLHRSANVAFPFEALDDEQIVKLGNVSVKVLHTPGHTPESVCLLVSDHRRGPEPWFVLTGDTLFVGTVGRPDLPGNEKENARQLHASIKEKLLPLADSIEIYPAHFSGSACGVGMSGKPMTTLAFEKRWNPVLSVSAEEFTAQVTGNTPSKPKDIEAVLKFNQGRAS